MHNQKLILKEATKSDPAFCPNGCGRSYKGQERKKSLRQHMIYACGVSQQFQCLICLKKFTYKHSLRSHMAMVHHKIL